MISCLCNTCSKDIEFDETQIGETIACPSCGLDTLLYRREATENPIEAEERARIEELERKVTDQEARDAAHRIRYMRVCTNCEQEVPARTKGDSFGFVIGIMWTIAIVAGVFWIVAGLALGLIALAFTAWMHSLPYCPECKSVNVVKIDSPAGIRILSSGSGG